MNDNHNQNAANVSLFDFKGHPVRVMEMDGEPWFVAMDASRLLYGEASKGSMAYKALPASEKSKVNRVALEGRGGKPLVLISESGLYKLVMRSDKPEAKTFQDWVTREVLPSIRKNGGYIAGQEKVATGEMSAAELARSVVGGM